MAPQRPARARRCAGRLARAAWLPCAVAACRAAFVAPPEARAAPRARAAAGGGPGGPPEPARGTGRARRDCGLGLLAGLSAGPAAGAAEGGPLATIRAAREEVAALVESYGDIIQGGPDAVRRRLGTIGKVGASVIFPGPGRPGALDAAYKAVAAETSNTELLELADIATGHLAKADEIAYSIFFVNDGGMRGSKKCKGGDCRPVYYEEARLELVAGLAALDDVLRSVQT